MIVIIYLILSIILLIVLLIILLKVKIFIFLKVSDIDSIQLKLIFYIKNITIYTYKKYIKSGIIKFINKDKTNKNINIKIDKIIKKISKGKMNLKIKVGVNNIIITNYIVVIVTTILSFLCSKYIKLKESKNIKFNVLPNYNSSCIIFESMLKIKVVTIILFFISQKIKSGGYKYGRTSN